MVQMVADFPDFLNKQMSTILSNSIVVSDEIVDFTVALAQDLSEMKRFPGNRKIDEKWVQFLYREAEKGKFRWEDVCISGVERLNGETYAVNGQHTCRMRIYLGEDYKCKVRILKMKEIR